MDLKKEIISGSGFAIVKIPDLKKFEHLRETFLNKMNLDGEKDIFVLREKLAKMKNHEINKAMVNLLSFNEASEKLIILLRSLIFR